MENNSPLWLYRLSFGMNHDIIFQFHKPLVLAGSLDIGFDLQNIFVPMHHTRGTHSFVLFVGSEVNMIELTCDIMTLVLNMFGMCYKIGFACGNHSATLQTGIDVLTWDLLLGSYRGQRYLVMKYGLFR